MPNAAIGLSPLAHSVDKLKRWPRRSAEVFGVCVHTTGSSIVEQAIEHGADPLEYAVAYYEKPDSYGPHYVIGYDGHIVQVSDEYERAAHAGLTAAQRQSFLSGEWRHTMPPFAVSEWVARWPIYASPSHLYPGPSINDVYIGIECLPVHLAIDPAGAGLKYTEAQHEAVAALAVDIAARWSFQDIWWRTSRLLGHEDVNPLTRANHRGGWDPGATREVPWWDWDRVIGYIANARSAAC